MVVHHALCFRKLSVSEIVVARGVNVFICLSAIFYVLSAHIRSVTVAYSWRLLWGILEPFAVVVTVTLFHPVLPADGWFHPATAFTAVAWYEWSCVGISARLRVWFISHPVWPTVSKFAENRVCVPLHAEEVFIEVHQSVADTSKVFAVAFLTKYFVFAVRPVGSDPVVVK